MRDQNEGIRVVGQVILQPVARFQIQVVCRFVQQQQVRFFQQQLRQSDAHLPAARKLLHALLPVFLTEPEAGQHAAHPRLNVVPVASRKLGLKVVVALRDLLVFEGLVIEFPHPVLQLFLLRFHGADVLEHRHAFIEH